LFDNKYLRQAAKDAKAFKSREVLTRMSIDDFLGMSKTPDYGFDSKKLEKLKDWDVEKAQIPFLSVDKTGQVVGHEGRHRAKRLKDAGETHIPVKIKSDTVRFDQQSDPTSFDYVDAWPKYLKEEDGAKVMRFPIKRGESGVI
jgi:hypothetical protein